MAITTIDNIKLWINKTSLNTLETNQINMLIPLVESMIENYCGWKVLARDYTKSGAGNGTTSLDLGISPINTVTSVLLDGVNITSQLTVDYLNGVFTFTDGESLFTAPDTAGTTNMVITFNAGYSTTSPILETRSDANAIAAAADYLTAMWFYRIIDENIGISEEKFNVTTTKFESTDLPFLVTRTLDRYRKLSVY